MTVKVDEHCFEQQEQQQINYSYPVKSVVITTCGQLYQQWASKKRMYAKMTKGLTLKVDYADTLEQCHSAEPVTILALHGAPGSHEDFKPFIEHYGSRNVRIIVPNYPGKHAVLYYALHCPTKNPLC